MRELKSILLVDDDPTTNFLNDRLLRRMNASRQIGVARNGIEAIQYLQACLRDPNEHPWPELILLDLNMPLMNGWEFLDAIATDDRFPLDRSTIVMLTTSLREEDRQRAEENELVQELIYKPLRADNLERIVDLYLPAASSDSTDH